MKKGKINWKKWIRYELDAEMMACTHGFVMIFLYLIESFVVGSDHIGFIQALQMGLLAYGSAWFQSALFISDRVYGKKEYVVRMACWMFLPVLATVAVGELCGWFTGMPHGVVAGKIFYGIMIAYYMIFGLFILYFFHSETRKLNAWLQQWKQKEKISGKEQEKI